MGNISNQSQRQTQQASQNIMTLNELVCSKSSIEKSEDNMNACQISKIKKIKKQKKTSSSNTNAKEDEKQSNAHHKHYFMFYLKYHIQNPCFKLSWAYWKTENIYKDMAKYINSKIPEISREPRQLKSYDENQKKQYYIENKVDILEACLTYLEPYINQDEVYELFQSFQKVTNSKGGYMELVQGALSGEEEAMLLKDQVKYEEPLACIKEQVQEEVLTRSQNYYDIFLDLEFQNQYNAYQSDLL